MPAFLGKVFLLLRRKWSDNCSAAPNSCALCKRGERSQLPYNSMYRLILVSPGSTWFSTHARTGNTTQQLSFLCVPRGLDLTEVSILPSTFPSTAARSRQHRKKGMTAHWKYIGIFPHSAVCYRSGTSGARGSVYWPGWIFHARHSSSPFLNHVKSWDEFFLFNIRCFVLQFSEQSNTKNYGKEWNILSHNKQGKSFVPLINMLQSSKTKERCYFPLRSTRKNEGEKKEKSI